MKIALDYDDTYTRDYKLWDHFIAQAQKRGHFIFIVTFRSRNGNNTDIEEHIGNRLPVFYTAGNRKRAFCASIDVFPDVWIDDMPELVGPDNAYVPGEVLAKLIGGQ